MKLKSINKLGSCIILATFPILGCSASTENPLPNIILILADDLGYSDLSCQGSVDIRTPEIDRLAVSGIRYTAGYVTSPQCGPSRAGLMTGIEPARYDYQDNNVNRGLPTESNVPTMAELLKSSNYTTGVIGKWHLGTDPFDPSTEPWPEAPWRRGFDYVFIHGGGLSRYFPYSEADQRIMLNQANPQDPRIREVKENSHEVTFLEFPEDSYITDLLTDAGVSFIDRHKDEPFFLYMAYNAPHWPLQAKQSDLDSNSNIKDEKRRIFAGMMTALDRGVGKILNTLDSLDLNENTIVVFLSDNGAPGPTAAGYNGSLNDPLRGHKGNMLEGGIRIPFIISYPGRIPSGMVDDQPVISSDLFRTFAELTGAEIDKKIEYPGISLIPTWSGESLARDTLVWRWRTKAAVRVGPYKYIDMWKGPDWNINPDLEVGLYNLDENPQELTDQSIHDNDLLEKMSEILRQWRKKYENQLF